MIIGGLGGPLYGTCSGNKPRSLDVLLHGYGANADDLIPLSYTWGPHLLDTLFLSLNAPFPHPTMCFGRQWFPMDDFDLARIWEDFSRLSPVLKTFLDEELAKYNLSYRNVFLVGFSQGATVALQHALYGLDVAGAISYSGFLVPHPHGGAPKTKPILLVHGDCDNVLPISFLSDAQKILNEGKVPFEGWISEVLRHGINPFGLKKGRVFLQRVLKNHPSHTIYKKQTDDGGRKQEPKLTGVSDGLYHGGEPKSLVVLLHGYGANADNLLPLAHAWSPFLLDSLFLSLNAPFLYSIVPSGRQWFPMDDFDMGQFWEELNFLTPVLIDFLDEELAKHALSYQDIVLVGFSQGAPVALQHAFYGLNVAWATSYSGGLVPHPQGASPKVSPSY